MWLLLALLALLPVLAFIQYQWIGQVGDAARQRAKARLESSLEHLITEFDSEITRAHMTFWQAPVDPENPFAGFAQRYQEWNRLAPYPQLIRDVYVIATVGETRELSRIEKSGQISPLNGWPQEFADIKARLEQNNRPGQPGLRRGSSQIDLSVAGNPVYLTPVREAFGGPPELFRRRSPRPEPGRYRGGEAPRRSPYRAIGWAVIVFNADYIKREFLPDLTRRLFTQSGETDYDLLVVNATNPQKVIYQSDPAPAKNFYANPDATASLFAMRMDCFFSPMQAPGTPGGRPFVPGQPPPDLSYEILTRKSFPCGKAALAIGKPDGRWQLLVKHHAGSLDAAFATFRFRTMAISFGVLLVLALGITMLTVSTERARVLAKLQMEFAMGVSHELRTPLTVIRVAADNLADGMMENAQHAQKYGRLIGGEARRLTEMVEQILTFARTQSPHHGSDLAPASPERIVRRAIGVCAPALREAGMEIERFIGPGLPLVSVDENLIVDCVQNLLNNAAKYAASGGWVRVSAEAVSDGERVQISVEDRGPGISPDDLPHIFDPFYRSEAVRSSQIPGVGLGLSLVKRIIEAHRGTIEVKSSAESGTCFALFLPAESAAPAEAEQEIREVAS
ncbi:MAG TPA: HAMP domain-containing sensor histidine kinase [Bryobacteraceae bacterium]|jgi:signal transduction histidine kinase|nr:HAMP domain-containing sensor histidine kinase [Bryobacteraceae bacterium]